MVLIVEDDIKFARIMTMVAHEHGYKAVVATRGDTGLSLANQLQPDAITLDIKLPMMDGWTLLERLKQNPRTRHIPVQVISVLERNRRAGSMGAFAYMEKPVSKEKLEGAFAHVTQFLDRKVRSLLLVEDAPIERAGIESLLTDGEDLKVVSVSSAEEALSCLEQGKFDCMVVDLILPGMDGIQLLEQVKTQPKFQELPVIVYTGKDLSPAEQKKTRSYAESVIVKNGPRSPENLLNDTALFLHRVQQTMPRRVRELIEEVSHSSSSLEGKKALIVDDDVRNIFALTSLLEDHHLEVVHAENGRAGIEVLKKTPKIDLVLMDIMMPGMDGYETIKAIRQLPNFRSVPIIALTAKAMKGDREKCIDAGASDYITKPVDLDQLFSVLRVWISYGCEMAQTAGPRS